MSGLWRKMQLIGVLSVLLLFGKRLLTAEGSDSNSDSGDSSGSGDNEISSSSDSDQSNSDSPMYGSGTRKRKSEDVLGDIPLPKD